MHIIAAKAVAFKEALEPSFKTYIWGVLDNAQCFAEEFKSKGYELISADYSQIELRILAHYSNEKRLVDAFNNNLDIHTRTAALIYGINNEDVKFNQQLHLRLNFYHYLCKPL